MLRRRVVMPSAPTSGNRLLANEAPLWIEIMAMISKHTGTSVEDALVVTDEDILSGLMELPSVWEGNEFRCCTV
ncbi:hypothetical protein D3C76_1797160 [compost metagenome]